MEVIKTSHLTKEQRKDLALLEKACTNGNGRSLSFPTEDADLVCLLYDPLLVSALFLIMPRFPDSDEAAECMAFTHPDFRRMGYFFRLFKEVQTEIEDVDLLFPTDGREEGALKALEFLGAEFSHAEYRMETELTGAELYSEQLSCLSEEEEDAVRTYRFFPGQASEIPAFTAGADGSSDPGIRPFPDRPLSYDNPAAICRAACFGEKACFYGFFVRPELRGQGLGQEALSHVLRDLYEAGIRSLFLHVSGDNLPAVAVYKKAGFRITETLSYYLY